MHHLFRLLCHILLLGQLRAHPHCDGTTTLSDIPHLDDCLVLVRSLQTMARLQSYEPIHWSRNPQATATRSRRLPFTFVDPLSWNDCEFVVDQIPLSPSRVGGDTFSTKVIAIAARVLVEQCLRRKDARPSLGSAVIGPRGVISLSLRKKVRRGSGAVLILQPNATVQASDSSLDISDGRAVAASLSQ